MTSPMSPLHAVALDGRGAVNTSAARAPAQEVTVDQFVTDMQIRNYSPITITDRYELIERFRATLDVPLLEATTDDLRAFQARFRHLAPATTNVYARHLKAFYDWAEKRRILPGRNPADDMIVPKVAKGRPHPTPLEDLRTILLCAVGGLRLAYVLAGFAGLRCGEVAQLTRADLDLRRGMATALVHGKGAKERIVPLLDPVVDEIEWSGLPRNGWVVRDLNGKPYSPARLSVDSSRFLRGLGYETTLHSMRGTFATEAARLTRNVLLVRDLLGHGSVATTEIYMQTSLADAHSQLAQVAELADDLLAGTGERRVHLRAVKS